MKPHSHALTRRSCFCSTLESCSRLLAIVAFVAIGSIAACGGAGGGPSAPLDAGTIVKCSQAPKTGDACGAEPADTLCRQNSCNGGCEPSCACCGGHWVCSLICVDSSDGGTASTEMAPLCTRDTAFAIEMTCRD